MQLVSLTLDGRHLQPGGAGDRRLRASTGSLGPGAVFERLDLGHGRVALRTLDGRFLATRPDPGLGFGIHPEDDLTPAAAFEEILWPDGSISLRSCHLTFVSAAGNGPVTVNRVDPDAGGRFRLVGVAAPVVPAQRGQSSAPRATSASPSSSAWRSDRMISGTA